MYKPWVKFIAFNFENKGLGYSRKLVLNSPWNILKYKISMQNISWTKQNIKQFNSRSFYELLINHIICILPFFVD